MLVWKLLLTRLSHTLRSSDQPQLRLPSVLDVRPPQPRITAAMVTPQINPDDIPPGYDTVRMYELAQDTGGSFATDSARRSIGIAIRAATDIRRLDTIGGVCRIESTVAGKEAFAEYAYTEHSPARRNIDPAIQYMYKKRRDPLVSGVSHNVK